MKNALMSILFMFPFVVYGQPAIRTTIPGTHCSLIPPPGFIISERFSGLENIDMNASIMVGEMQMPSHLMSSNMTAENMVSRGMILTTKETLLIENNQRTYIRATQEVNGFIVIKQLLIFGDSTSTIIVNCASPEGNPKLEEDMKSSMLTTNYVQSEMEPTATFKSFDIDVKGTDFKFTQNVNGALIYTIDGNVPTENAMVLLARSTTDPTIVDQKKYALERLAKLPRGEKTVINSIDTISVDNLTGYEIKATGKDKNDNNQLIYEMILYPSSGGYYLFVGNSAKNTKKFTEVFKLLARTFKRH